MIKNNRWLALLSLATIEGIFALVYYFQVPSETANSGLLGFSTSRWLVGGLAILIWIGLVAGLFFLVRKWDLAEPKLQRLNTWLDEGSHAWVIRVLLFALLIVCLELYLLTYLAYPIHLRPLILWVGLVIFEGLGWLFYFFRKPLHGRAGWQQLSRTQKIVFWVLIGVGVLFFILFIPQNMQGVQDRHQLSITGGDENITYPVVEWMLKLTGKPEEWIYGLIVYEDYHYGYPFYFVSALAVLPVRIVFGPNFGDQTLINMLILRQLVSAFPMLLASLILVWMSTHFRSLWKSVLLYLLLLLIPNAAFYNIRFWHPDGLVVLAAVFTLFFLTRDRYRLGWNFYAAAITCGLASAIKLYGFFFVFTIPIYLLACHWDGKIPWKKIAVSAVFFVLTMTFTIFVANPFLGVPSARERFLQIQTQKSGEITVGYNQPDPEHVYSLGLHAWLPFLEKGFGPVYYLAFLVLSLVISSLWGKNRLNPLLFLSWFVVNAFYLINFSAVKSQHYWLPAMLPLYGSALSLLDLSPMPSFFRVRLSPRLRGILKWGAILAAMVMIGINGYASRSIFTELFHF